jgi:hypothetical protein
VKPSWPPPVPRRKNVPELGSTVRGAAQGRPGVVPLAVRPLRLAVPLAVRPAWVLTARMSSTHVPAPQLGSYPGERSLPLRETQACSFTGMGRSAAQTPKRTSITSGGWPKLTTCIRWWVRPDRVDWRASAEFRRGARAGPGRLQTMARGNFRLTFVASSLTILNACAVSAAGHGDTS